jgi:hypothetical protein
VFAVATTGQANITHHTDEAAPRNENSIGMLPHFVELVVKSVIILDAPKLAFVVGVLLKCPIGRRGKDEMDRPRWNPVHFPGIPAP